MNEVGIPRASTTWSTASATTRPATPDLATRTSTASPSPARPDRLDHPARRVAPTLKRGLHGDGRQERRHRLRRRRLRPAIKELGRAASTTPARSASAPSASTSTSRSSIRFAERLVKYAKTELRYGYPDDDATNFGPVVSDEHRDKVLSYYKLAEEEGAKVLHGGGAPDVRRLSRDGVLGRADDLDGPGGNSRVVTRGDFRPGRGPIAVRNEEEAIRLANDTKYGLAATFCSTNSCPRHRVGRSWRSASAGSTPGSSAICALPSAASSIPVSAVRAASMPRVLHRAVQRLYQDLISTRFTARVARPRPGIWPAPGARGATRVSSSETSSSWTEASTMSESGAFVVARWDGGGNTPPAFALAVS